MSFFDPARAGDSESSVSLPVALSAAAAAVVACVALWVINGDSPITRFLLAAPIIGFLVLLATFGVRQLQPEDDILIPKTRRASEMTPRSRWESARFRHDELRRDFLPYDEDRGLRERFAGLHDRGNRDSAKYREARNRAELLRTEVFPGEAMGDRYVEAVQILAHDWAVARRRAERD